MPTFIGSLDAVDPIPEATDPSLCRVSGYLKDVHGSPMRGWAFVLRYKYSPLAYSSTTLFMRERLPIKSDATGYVEFDLVRGAVLVLELPNFMTELYPRTLTVPDRASVSVVGFMFPYVETLTWDEPGPLALVEGEQFDVCLTGTRTDGTTVAVSPDAVTITTSDSAVVDVVSGSLYEAKLAGAATLSVTTYDHSVDTSYVDNDGNSVVFLELPAPTLPADISVTVT